MFNNTNSIIQKVKGKILCSLLFFSSLNSSLVCFIVILETQKNRLLCSEEPPLFPDQKLKFYHLKLFFFYQEIAKLHQWLNCLSPTPSQGSQNCFEEQNILLSFRVSLAIFLYRKNTLWPSSFHNALWLFYEYRVEHSRAASLGKEEGCNVKATLCPCPILSGRLRCFLQKPYSFLKNSLKSATLQKTEAVCMKIVNPCKHHRSFIF